ncbi:hypothetical protein BRD00_08205 [Halobacteriales archaeon QS_8_69_26]|nr:MAG: hypothetical protein BRD00_08205 [Halobacteriales archaeon QS_8_69_26]
MPTGHSAGQPGGTGDAATEPIAGLSPGTTLLVAGPPMIGKYDLALEVLGVGNAAGESGVVVSTRGDERAVIDDYARTVPEFDPSMLGVVECVSGTRSGGTEVTEDGVRVRRAGSPADLTGVGIGASELMQEFDAAGSEGVRLAMDSLATVLMYADFERVCRFLHVLSGRIVQARGVGLFVINPATVDASQYDQLKTLFDGLVELRETEAGREYRVRGLRGATREWREYVPPGEVPGT